MEQYISKAALVAEIEKLQDSTTVNGHFRSQYYEGIFDGLSSIERFINTLEAKEVGLDLGSPYGDMGVKTVWDEDKIVSSKVQKGGEA